MKKVNLLFLCMIAFISCNEEQDLDLSVNQNDAGKEIVLKERDSRYPLILSEKDETKKYQIYTDTILQ